MEEVKNITDQLEYLYANKLIMGLRDKTITIDMARESAKRLLQLEPFTSIDDAKVKITDYVNNFQVFKVMKDFIDGYQEELKKNEVIARMREHMRTGDIDKALQVAKE